MRLYWNAYTTTYLKYNTLQSEVSTPAILDFSDTHYSQGTTDLQFQTTGQTNHNVIIIFKLVQTSLSREFSRTFVIITIISFRNMLLEGHRPVRPVDNKSVI